MIHPDTELRFVNPEIGFGVFATRPLPRGTIVWALCDLDQRIPPERVRRLNARYAQVLDRYAFTNGQGDLVLCWDHARWVNHSCQANLLSSGWDFDIAVRDIAAGDEITNDYAALNLDEAFTCHCRTPGCRGRIRPSDFEALADTWDGQVREAFADLGQVPQALWKWVSDKRSITAALQRPERVPSVRRHRYAPLVPAARTGRAPRRAAAAAR